MKLLQLSALAIRLLGIYVFLKTISLAPSMIKQISLNQDTSGLLGVFFAYNGIFFLLSIIFVLFPATMAKLLVPFADEVKTETAIDYNKIETCAFAVLGMYMLSYSIPDFFYNVIILIMAHGRETYYQTNFFEERVVSEIATVIEIIIALFLLLRAKGVSNLLYKLRS